MSKESVAVDFEYELDSGKEVHVYAEFTFIYDSNYGADADGNRGMPMSFAELDFIEIFNSDGINIYDSMTGKELKKIEDEAEDRAASKLDKG